MRIRSTLCIALASLALVACSGHRKLDLPPEQVAEVRGLDEFAVLGMARTLLFEEIDGEKLKGGFGSSLPSTIDLPEGKHKLRCYYSVKLDGRPGPSGTSDVELVVEAGSVYQGTVVLDKIDTARVVFSKLSAEDLETERARKTDNSKGEY